MIAKSAGTEVTVNKQTPRGKVRIFSFTGQGSRYIKPGLGLSNLRDTSIATIAHGFLVIFDHMIFYCSVDVFLMISLRCQDATDLERILS